MNVKLITAAVVTGFVANMAAAQTSAFDNRGNAEDAIDDLADDIDDQNERDITFGTDGRDVGDYGSVSLRFSQSSTSGNVDSTDLGVGMRYGSFDGVQSFDINLAFVYGEDDGVETTNQLLAGMDYRRNFGQAFFGYLQADIAIDELADAVDDIEQDIFVGFGAGYRIYNTSDLQWSVQAGPGYRYIETVGRDTVDEAAASISSNLYYALSDTIYITNDTDVIYSELLTSVSNDLAANVSLGNNLSLRTSYTVSFDDKDDDIFEDGDSILGASIVYNFN